MVRFSEHAIVETDLRFDRKLLEANVDRSEGDTNFKLVDQDGWSVQSGCKYNDICSHDRSSVLIQSKKTTIMSADTPTSTLASIARLAVPKVSL